MLTSRVQTDTNANVGAKLLLGQSANRVSLTLFPPAAGTAYVSSDNDPSATKGIALVAGGSPVVLHVLVHGDAVQDPWYIAYAAASSAISFIEALT